MGSIKVGGILVRVPEQFKRLEKLVKGNAFELLIGEKCRAIYMCNDAAESFLIFENYHLQGDYDPGREGELSLYLEVRQQDYRLSICQQKKYFSTLVFTDITYECSLYQYGKMGHFWIPKYEDLRQLEYRIGLIREKYDYCGPEYCNEKEKRLVNLAKFPPLFVHHCVPRKYRVDRPDPWGVTGEAFEVMEEIAEKAQDYIFLKDLKKYKDKPNQKRAEWLGKRLRHKRHTNLVRLIGEEICAASMSYPERKYSEKRQIPYEKLKQLGLERVRSLIARGIQAELLVEEPFVGLDDGITYKIHIVITKKGLFERKLQIETIEVECPSAIHE